MKLHPSEIKWPKRIRQDFGDLTELRKSIAEDRLGAPVTINKDRVLVDGGRRLKAWKMEHGDEPIECFIYSGPLDPLVMEIKMGALVKKFTPDEIYAAGQVLEKLYRPQPGEAQKKAAAVKKGIIPAVTDKESTFTDSKVAKDLDIDRGIYRNTKRLFEPEAEEKIGKKKAEELRQMAREKGITPAYEALKDEEYRQQVKSKPKANIPAIILSGNEAQYIYRLRRAIGWIRKPPNPISENGLSEIKKVLAEMKSIIEEALNA